MTHDRTYGAWQVAKKRSGGIELRREGTAPALSYAFFSVWANGVQLEIPIGRVRRNGAGWIAEGRLRTAGGTWLVEDALRPCGNTLAIDRRWRYRGGRIGSVRLGMDLEVPFRKVEFWAIPYISMNGNTGSQTAPGGMAMNGEPWIFREERTTAPGLVTLEADSCVAGSYTEPGRSEKTLCACCVLPVKHGHTVRTFFPFCEGPYTFLGSGHPGNSRISSQGIYTNGSGGSNGFVVEGDMQFRRKFFVVLDRAEGRRHGYAKVWESAWRHLRDPIAPSVPLKETEKLLWQSLDHFWVETGKARGFSLRIDRDGDAVGSWSPILGAGWCAPTMMLAWLAIRRAIRSGKPGPAERVVRAAEFFIGNAGQKSGVFLTHFNLKQMRWMDGGLDAVQMGGAAFWILKCAQLLRGTKLFGRRIDVRKWTDFALGFCDLAVRTQLSNGAFGSAWTKEGRCLGTERAMGVHAGRAALEAYRLTGKKDYLRAAERGAAFTIRALVDREAGYGDCTDLLNTTTENDGAGVPDFLLDLYRETGKARYLAKAVRSAEYCLSFMFAYNVHFPPETECGRRGMRTRGSSAISPETAFVSFWFAHQANVFLELWKETKDRRWKEYAMAVIRGTLQMMSERGDTFGLAPHLTGCRAEVLPVLDTVKGGHVWKKGMTGYTWHQPVWWPAAFNLMNFAVIEDRFPELMGEFK